jgi:hypothetical protein
MNPKNRLFARSVFAEMRGASMPDVCDPTLDLI